MSPERGDRYGSHLNLDVVLESGQDEEGNNSAHDADVLKQEHFDGLLHSDLGQRVHRRVHLRDHVDLVEKKRYQCTEGRGFKALFCVP